MGLLRSLGQQAHDDIQDDGNHEGQGQVVDPGLLAEVELPEQRREKASSHAGDATCCGRTIPEGGQDDLRAE